METISALFGDDHYRHFLAIIFLAGVVRGFSGFGTGMIAGPAGAAMFSPQAAIVTIFIIDVGPASVLLPRALKKVDWLEVLPLSLGYMLVLPAGILFLKHGDPVLLRWLISAAIFACVVLIWSGWVYRGPRTPTVSVLVGALSGFLGGSMAIGGPPVIIYWMAARTGSGLVRANLIVFFAICQFGTLLGYILADLFTWQFFAMGLLACPVYLVALLAGSRIYDRSSEAFYRRVALSLVFAAALLSAPALDGWLRS